MLVAVKTPFLSSLRLRPSASLDNAETDYGKNGNPETFLSAALQPSFLPVEACVVCGFQKEDIFETFHDNALLNESHIRSHGIYLIISMKFSFLENRTNVRRERDLM